MTNIIEHLHNGQRWLFVEVPEGAYGIKLKWYREPDDRFHIGYRFSENHYSGFIVWYKDLGGKKKYPKRDSLFIHADTSTITDEQAMEMVPVKYRPARYWNYILNYHREFYAIDSLHSLIRSKGGDSSKRYVVLKAVK